VASKLSPEEAEVTIEWPDGEVTQGRMLVANAGTLGLGPAEWLAGPLLDHVRARGLSTAEREAMCAQVAEAELEFRACLHRPPAPRAPGIPRVTVRAIRGWDGAREVAWLSRDELAGRMRAVARRLAAASRRFTEAAAANRTAAERDALAYEVGYLAAALERCTAQLEADAAQVGEFSAADFRALR
jgi:hypothetical protein